MTRKYILTGGPGSGKATLLRELSGAGFYTMKEVAEYLIDLELRRGGNILPHTNRDEFQKRVLQTQRQWEKEIPTEITYSFQDRGIPDGIAFYLADNINPPEELIESAREAKYDQILILDPSTNYKNTRIRRENQEKSLKVHEKIWEVYQKLGYNPISMPVEPIADRFWRTINLIDTKEDIYNLTRMEVVGGRK